MPGAKLGAPGLQAYDVADHLRNEQEIDLYLTACREEGGTDAAFVATAVAGACVEHPACDGHRSAHITPDGDVHGYVGVQALMPA